MNQALRKGLPSRSTRQKHPDLKSTKPSSKALKISGSTAESPYFGHMPQTSHGRSASSLEHSNLSSLSKVKLKHLSPFSDYLQTVSRKMVGAPVRRHSSKKSEPQKVIVLSPKPRVSAQLFKKMDTPPLICKRLNLSVSPKPRVPRSPGKFRLEPRKKQRASKK